MAHRILRLRTRRASALATSTTAQNLLPTGRTSRDAHAWTTDTGSTPDPMLIVARSTLLLDELEQAATVAYEDRSERMRNAWRRP